MLKKSLYGIVIAVLLFTFASGFGQVPNHSRLLYHVPLTSDTPNAIGQIAAVGGEFTSSGWTPRSSSGQLRVDLKSFLPAEGTIKVTVTGMMPVVNNEWVPMALYSRGAGGFDEVDKSPGSYIFIKTDERYKDKGLDFKFFSSTFYGANEATGRKDSPVYAASWSPGSQYVLQITWNREMTWFLVNGQVRAYQVFAGQIETFGYIFLGRDNTYSTTMNGVNYKDLKVYVPETDYPFSNIANPYNEMAHAKIGGQGVAITDVDNNGEEDIYASTFYNTTHPVENLFYVRKSGSFSEEAATRGVNDAAYAYQSIFGDFDKDGDDDLFVINFHRAADYPNEPNHYYVNDGLGNFTNRTADLGGNVAADSKGGTMLDIEKDGDLDVVVICAADAHKVYVNNGAGKFTVQTKGLENFRLSSRSYRGVSSGDLNGDGAVDLVVVHDTGLSLAKNNGSGTFVSAGDLPVPAATKAVTLADFDNDADLDMLVAVDATAGARVEIFRNDGNFVFSNISTTQTIAISTFGILTGDWNNDGKVDFFAVDKLSNGKVYMGDGTGRFIEAPKTGVEVKFASARGAATFDANDDGRLDIYAASVGGIAIDDVSKAEKLYNRNYLFRNDITNAGNYLKVAVVDDNNNRAGFGDKIWLYRAGQLNNPGALVGYGEILSTNALNSSSSPVQHFGLGGNTSVDVKVKHLDGTEKTLSNVGANQTLVISPVQIVPSRLVRDFDAGQAAVAGKSYNIAYKVYSTEDEAVANHPVLFEITQGNGSLDPSTSVMTKNVNTDQEGRAVVQWKLGPSAGVNQIRATSSHEGAALTGSPDNYSVTATADVPRDLLKTGGDAQLGYAGAELPNELSARVVDQLGNGIASHPVEFTIAEGGGMLKSGGTTAAQITVNTDVSGYARIRWILGAQLGQQKVNARATYQSAPLTNSPLTFTATAQPPQRKLSYVSGDDQIAPINTQLPNPFVVRLLDADNLPLVNEDVKFVASGGGKIAGLDSVTAKTDPQGYARATGTLGAVVGDSIYVFKAYAANASGSPVTFVASATGGPAAKFVYVDGNNQTGIAGRYLPNSLRVRVTDANDLPVRGFSVQFSVTTGGGQVNGSESVVATTDGQGIAAARWKLGGTIGANNVLASAVGLSLPGVTFRATGIVGPAARLAKYSGDNQKGTAGQPLAQYFVATVTDSFYNVVANHQVTFAVVTGGGNLGGQTQVTQTTNAFGQAQVLLTLGPIDYAHSVRVTSTINGLALIGSPQTFNAYLGPGDPETLLLVSGNNQIGAVNRELPEPFVVKVVDKNSVSVPNVEVEFITFSPGASFGGAPSIKVRTNDSGLALAMATLGSNFGNNNYAFEAIAKFNNKHLKNSPMQFTASGRRSLATKMQKIDGDQVYSGTVGQNLADSLRVVVLDANNQPVAGHPVLFQVQDGLALIDGKHTSQSINSNGKGVAAVRLKLGTRPGSSHVRASADDGLNPLTPAYLDFTANAITGPASASTSTITAQSGLVADGQSVSSVSIVLLDEFRNPVTAKYVTLQTTGADVLLTQPTAPTNGSGAASGSLKSINIGAVTIWALVDNQPLVSTEIEFVPGPPMLATKLNNAQTQEKGKPLPLPVGLQVQDAYSHPIKDLPVTFTVRSGKGSIVEPQPALTNAEGKAWVHWTLGDSLGEQKLRASVLGMVATQEFIAYAVPPASGTVRVVSGDSLIAVINQNLPMPFTVRVADLSGQPISNIPVEFTLLTPGGGTWQATNKPNTNSQGQASALLRAGSTSGEFQVIATAKTASTNYGSVFFNFKIQPVRTVTITRLTADGQTIRPKTELPVAIKVTDAYNRPIAAEQITFVQVQGQGFIKENLPLSTNASGMLTATWVVGNSGPQQMEIRAVNAASAATYFTALVVNGAPYFAPPLQKNIATDAGNTVQFVVNAVDPDDDPIYYFARNLPAGAQFDKTNTHRFTWTPAANQAGEHHVTFVVMDDFGAADSAIVNIVVDIRNLAPIFTSHSPEDTVMVVAFNRMLTFQVSAQDPNGDALNYEWTVNDAFASDTYVLPLVFTREAFPDSFAAVKARAYDNFGGQRTITWRIHLQLDEAVELASFAAVAENNTVRLLWQTSKEKNTAGFYVLKSRREEGPFTEINASIIKPQPGGHYVFVDDHVVAGDRFYYKLKEVDIYGISSEFGPVQAEVALPTRLALAQNYPNPFNPSTTIRFELPAAFRVQIAVYNATGQLVRQLVNDDYVAGIHQVVWDAKNESGLRVPSGIYYYRMTADGFSDTKKLLLLK